MSINRFLFSACLPVMIFSLAANVTPAQAGFDWTPPEDTKEVVMPDVPVTPVQEQNLPPFEDRSNQDNATPVFEQPLMKEQSSGEVKMKTKVLAPQNKQTAQSSGSKATEGKPEIVGTDSAQNGHIRKLEKKQTMEESSNVLPLPTDEVVEEKQVVPTVVEQDVKPLQPIEKQFPEPVTEGHSVVSPQHEVTEVKQKKETPASQKMSGHNGEGIDSYGGVGEKKKAITSKDTSIKEIPPMQKEAEQKPKAGELLINPFPLENKAPQPDQQKQDIVPAHAAVKKDEAPEAEKMTPSQSAYPVVEGFGSDMPLVMALGQIVPAQYAYSFGKGVNPGVIISWEGGKPWDEVLNGVLTPLGVQMSIEGNKLSLFVPAVNEPAPVKRTKANLPVPTSYPDPDNNIKRSSDNEIDGSVTKKVSEKPSEPSVPKVKEGNIQPIELEKKPSEETKEKKVSVKEVAEKVSKTKKKPEEKKTEEKLEESDGVVLESAEQKKNNSQHPQLKDVLVTSPDLEKKSENSEKIDSPAFPEFEMKDGKLLSPSAPVPVEDKEKTKSVKEETKKKQPESLTSKKEQKEESKSSNESLLPILPQEIKPAEVEPIAEEKKKTPIDSKKIKIWEAKKGKDLQTLLKEWCDQIGVELEWSAKDKYKLAHNVVVSGTLESALKVTFAQAVKNPPHYEFVKGDAPKVIVK